MPTRWKGDLLLSECFDFVSDIDSSALAVSMSNSSRVLENPNLSSEAFSSKTPSFYASPKSWWAKQWMLVVFRYQAFPKSACRSDPYPKRRSQIHTEMTTYVQFPSFAMTLSLSIVSWFPTISSKT